MAGAGVNRGDTDAERAVPNFWDTTPENQAPTFRNQDQVWPVRVIRRSDAVRPLPPHARSLADLSYEAGGVRLGVSDFMARRRRLRTKLLAKRLLRLSCGVCAQPLIRAAFVNSFATRSTSGSADFSNDFTSMRLASTVRLMPATMDLSAPNTGAARVRRP